MGIVTLWGPPNSGKTTLAIDLAFALTRNSKSVLLVSAAPYAELSARLKIRPTIHTCLAAAYKQPGALKQTVCQADELLYVLSANCGYDVFTAIEDPRAVKELLKQARALYDTVIVDCSATAFMALSAWAMRMAEHCIILTGSRSAAVEWHKSFRQALMQISTKLVYVCAEISRYFDYRTMMQAISLSDKSPVNPIVTLPHINNADLIQETKRTLLDAGTGTGNRRSEVKQYVRSVQILCSRLEGRK